MKEDGVRASPYEKGTFFVRGQEWRVTPPDFRDAFSCFGLVISC